MGAKYEFTNETMNFDDYILHRIKRLSDDKLGGWIEKEDNLSQDGNCWVDTNAKVYDDARIYGNAQISGFAEVYGDACVYGNAKIYENAQICGVNEIYGNAKVFGNAIIYDFAEIFGNAKIYGNAIIRGNAQVCDDVEIYDKVQVFGDAKVYGDAKVFGSIRISSGEYASGDYFINVNNSSNEDASKEVVQDFIYKVDNSNKLKIKTEYNSIDEFFSEPIKNDITLDTLIICTIDTKEPLIKLQKVDTDATTEFKFIIDLTNKDGDNFIFKSIIKSQEQLNQLIQQTIDMLKQSSQFAKYVDDLENCL